MTTVSFASPAPSSSACSSGKESAHSTVGSGRLIGVERRIPAERGPAAVIGAELALERFEPEVSPRALKGLRSGCPLRSCHTISSRF